MQEDCQWISVEDKLPEIPEGLFAVQVICCNYNEPDDGVQVIMYERNRGFIELICGHEGGEWVDTYLDVTHWMYLPRVYIEESNGRV